MRKKPDIQRVKHQNQLEKVEVVPVSFDFVWAHFDCCRANSGFVGLISGHDVRLFGHVRATMTDLALYSGLGRLVLMFRAYNFGNRAGAFGIALANLDIALAHSQVQPAHRRMHGHNHEHAAL